MSTSTDLWTFRDQRLATTDITGFEVEATDGDIGKVDDATKDVGGSYVIVDTGPWIFGKKVMLPASVLDDIDLDAQKIYVRRTKDEIKNAPEFDEMRLGEEAYRDEYTTYYGPGGPGYRDPLL
jgi:PRC-barrel domain